MFFFKTETCRYICTVIPSYNTFTEKQKNTLFFTEYAGESQWN